MQIIDKIKLLELVNNYDFIIVDRQVKEIHLENLHSCYVLDNAEESKSIKVYEQIINEFIEGGIKRNSKILAIGGGATSDLAGFVASTILRGVEWDIIPTTLLSMIDAAIGGKVGVNSYHGKNLIGAFHNPTNIFYNFDFLETLPKKEYDSGLGELMKYCFLSPKIAKNIDLPTNDLILMCAEFKQDVVNEDFKEKGKRVILNLGHTFGHSIERNSSLSHGESVLLGLYFLFSIFDQDQLDNLNKYSYKLNLSVPLISLDLNDFLKTLAYDKKNQSELIKFILPNGFVEVSTTDLKQRLIQNEKTKLYFS